MWTQRNDPINFRKVLKIPGFFQFCGRQMLFCTTLSTEIYSIMGQCMGQLVDPNF